MRPTNLSAPEIKYVAHAGQRFGRLTFVDEYHDGRNRKWRMRCDCGAEKVMQPANCFYGYGLGCAKRSPKGVANRCAVLDVVDAPQRSDAMWDDLSEDEIMRIDDKRAELAPHMIRDIARRVPASVFDLGRMA
jgi:hypothetical protein